MSFFGQVSHTYNSRDIGQNLSDIQGVLGLLSEEKRKKFEYKVLKIAQQKREGLYAIRNKLYEAYLYASNHKKSTGVKGLDRLNPRYQELLYIYDEISKNPTLRTEFLSRLSEQIDEILSTESPSTPYINIEGVTDGNFDKQLEFISKNCGHAGVVYFLGECISEGKCLDKIEIFLNDKRGEKSLEGASLEDIDFFNLESRLEFKKKILNTKLEGKSFSLSGGISNALSQIGYIREHYQNGGKISSLSGTSMGAIVAVLISKVVGTKTGENAVRAIDAMVNKLKDAFQNEIRLLGKAGKIPFLSINKTPEVLKKERTHITKSDVEVVQKIFLNFANEYGIDGQTKFSELEIPVIINASYQSKDGSGEKEVIISGENSIIDALFAGANMPSMSQQNVGIFGIKKLQGLELVDFAANEKGNPISLLTNNGINKSDIVVLDVGYSSTEYNTGAAAFSRGFFERALFRDMIEKTDIRNSGGVSIDFDVEGSDNKSGSAFSPEIIDKLIKIGNDKFKEVQSTSQSAQ